MLTVCTPNDVIPATQKLTGTMNEHFHYAFFRTMEATGRDWEAAAPERDFFLQRAYLQTLEQHPPLGMKFGYLILYKQDRPIGVAICQIKYFKAEDSLQDLQAPSSREICFFSGLAKWFKKRVAGWAASEVLIIGNLLLTGEHAWHYDRSAINGGDFAKLLDRAVASVVQALEQEGIKIPIVLLKDVAPEAPVRKKKFLDRLGYYEFCIQPNMVMELPFSTFDAYLLAMSTKYRTRYKRATKKAAEVEKRQLGRYEIEQELDTIYTLYKEIANNAGFNMVDLNKHYLPALCDALGTRFKLTAYYLKGQMCCFYTTIHNGTEMEAHFLGYDKHFNHDYQLYLNMLYNIVESGINAGCERIVFARTALEIKSSVGAVGHDLYCYVRHQNPLMNRLSSTLLDYMKPEEIWQPRHPFKAE